MTQQVFSIYTNHFTVYVNSCNTPHVHPQLYLKTDFEQTQLNPPPSHTPLLSSLRGPVMTVKSTLPWFVSPPSQNLSDPGLWHVQHSLMIFRLFRVRIFASGLSSANLVAGLWFGLRPPLLTLREERVGTRGLFVCCRLPVIHPPVSAGHFQDFTPPLGCRGLLSLHLVMLVHLRAVRASPVQTLLILLLARASGDALAV